MFVMSDCIGCEVGDNFVVAVNTSRHVHILGAPNSHGKKRTSSHGSMPPTRVEGISEVVQVAACSNSFLALMEDGSLWGCGAAINNGVGESTSELRRLELPPIRFAALGSRNGAAIGVDGGSLWVWGDGISGSLGIGKRVKVAPKPIQCISFKEHEGSILHISCTRGQPNPKRVMKPFSPGQEGPRMHVVTADGGLWIAGTSHKGLACDHMHKVMQPNNDHLIFYRVGGLAADATTEFAVPTGAAEGLAVNPELGARRMGLRDPGDYGRGGFTHYLEGVSIASSHAAHIHSLAVSEDGRLFAWGCGSDGRTGLEAYVGGPGGSKRTLKCYVSTPSVVEALDGRRVIAAACGRYWSFAIVDE